MRITPRQFDRLNEARARDGLAIQEHIRRALDYYLTSIERADRKPVPVADQTQPQPTVEQRVAPRLTMR
jgi:hypothetical protein